MLARPVRLNLKLTPGHYGSELEILVFFQNDIPRWLRSFFRPKDRSEKALGHLIVHGPFDVHLWGLIFSYLKLDGGFNLRR